MRPYNSIWHALRQTTPLLFADTPVMAQCHLLSRQRDFLPEKMNGALAQNSRLMTPCARFECMIESYMSTTNVLIDDHYDYCNYFFLIIIIIITGSGSLLSLIGYRHTYVRYMLYLEITMLM